MNNYTYWGIVALAVLVAIALADYLVFGQLAVGIYALFAFWRQESKQAFQLAMIMLGVMLGALVVNQTQVVTAFSAYAFLLMLVGVFVLSRELWRYSHELRAQKKGDNAD